MSGHTPGPWEVVDGNEPGPGFRTRVARPGGLALIQACNQHDAHLIAAAPDLLEASRRWLRLMGKAGADACGCVAEESYVCCRCEVMAAIAKAEGRS